MNYGLMVERELMANLPRTVEGVVETALPLIGDSTKTGGYFCLSRRNTGRVLLVTQIGDVSPEGKATKYFDLCQEKCQRLFQNHGHVSSFQSRNEDEGRWGGAIATQDFFLGFSGFPEKWDEVCMLEVVRREPLLKLTFANYATIIRASSNEFVTETFGGFERHPVPA